MWGRLSGPTYPAETLYDARGKRSHSFARRKNILDRASFFRIQTSGRIARGALRLTPNQMVYCSRACVCLLYHIVVRRGFKAVIVSEKSIYANARQLVSFLWFCSFLSWSSGLRTPSRWGDREIMLSQVSQVHVLRPLKTARVVEVR